MYVIYSTEQEAIDVCAQLDQALGYPKPDVLTDHATFYKKHPTLDQWAVCMRGVEDQLPEGKTLVDLTHDWTPPRNG